MGWHRFHNILKLTLSVCLSEKDWSILSAQLSIYISYKPPTVSINTLILESRCIPVVLGGFLFILFRHGNESTNPFSHCFVLRSRNIKLSWCAKINRYPNLPKLCIPLTPLTTLQTPHKGIHWCPPKALKIGNSPQCLIP